MKKFMNNEGLDGEQHKKKRPDLASKDAEKEDEGSFPEPKGCLMIFGGPDMKGSKCSAKLDRREGGHHL